MFLEEHDEVIIDDENRSITIKGLKNFNPKHIFECGQCFRWDPEEDGSYTGIAFGKVLNVSKVDDLVVFKNTNFEDFKNIWVEYFDLNRRYSEIKEMLSKKDKYLNEAVKFGDGIRILKQDGWEMLISFIISANNRIPMIKRVIDTLSKKYGVFVQNYNGKDFYSFPSPIAFAETHMQEIRACSTGFRDKYIKKTSEAVILEDFEVNSLREVSGDECRKKLMSYSGVGAKVADCIALFGMQKYDSFPVDVWVKRVMQEFYNAQDMSLPKMRKFGVELFGKDAGFAQQYLFYYVRENQIGK